MSKKYDIGFLGGKESDDKVIVELTNAEFDDFKYMVTTLDRAGKKLGDGLDPSKTSEDDEDLECNPSITTVTYSHLTSIRWITEFFRTESFVAPLCGLINHIL